MFSEFFCGFCSGLMEGICWQIITHIAGVRAGVFRNIYRCYGRSHCLGNSIRQWRAIHSNYSFSTWLSRNHWWRRITCNPMWWRTNLSNYSFFTWMSRNHWGRRATCNDSWRMCNNTLWRNIWYTCNRRGIGDNLWRDLDTVDQCYFRNTSNRQSISNNLWRYCIGSRLRSIKFYNFFLFTFFLYDGKKEIKDVYRYHRIINTTIFAMNLFELKHLNLRRIQRTFGRLGDF